MARLVVLTPSANAQDTGYDVRLGPLSFVTPADTVGETVGDGLEAVGAALTASDRRPRPLKLKLPVRGYHLAVDPVGAGKRLRRHIRQVFDNPAWRLSGFYFVWDADPDLDGWLLAGGADLSETDPGISFGEFEMDLTDVYIVGRPGTHRPGRRALIGDRRGGLVPRDTRRLLYSTDFSSQALPAEPLVLPGDVVDLVASGNRPVSSTTAGPVRGARHLWRTAAAADAEILTYLPDEVVLPGRTRYLDLDDLGAVRVWDLSQATPYPPVEAGYTTERDTDPDIYWGWEQVLGDVLTASHPLAIDNGAVRLIWLGPAAGQGLAIEYWDDTLGHYRREGRVLHSLNVREQHVVECTPERAVVEWRAGQYGMRAILQRGWWGPRLESFDDGGGTARLEWAPQDGVPTVATQTPSWVRSIAPAGILQKTNYVINPSAEIDTSSWQAGIPVRTNLVTNPSFEYGTTGLATTDGAYLNAGAVLTNPAGGIVGAKCAEIVGNGSAASEGIIETVAAPAGGWISGQPYTFSVYIRAVSGATSFDMGLGKADASDFTRVNKTGLTSAFARYSVTWIPTATTTANASVVIESIAATAYDWQVDGLMVNVGSSVLPYFDGDTPGYGWTGVPGASTSSNTATVTNFMTNPSFETGTTGWDTTARGSLGFGGGAAISVNTANFFYGTQSMRVVTPGSAANEGTAFLLPGTFKAGVTYTMTVRLKGNAGGESIYWQVCSVAASSGDQASITPVITSSWAEYRITWTPNADRTDAILLLKNTGTSAYTYFVDAVGVFAGTNNAGYFDGTFVGAAWSGTAHASTSTRSAAGVANLVYGGFESGIGSWLGTTSGYAAPTLLAVQSGWAAAGMSSLRGTFASAGTSAHLVSHDWTTAASAVVEGQAYSAVAAVNLLTNPAGGTALRIIWHNAAGTAFAVSTTAAQTGTGVKTYSLLSQIAPVGARSASVDVYVATASGGWDLYIDSVVLTPGTAALNYFDGDSPSGWWMGAKGGSASVLPALTRSNAWAATGAGSYSFRHVGSPVAGETPTLEQTSGARWAVTPTQQYSVRLDYKAVVSGLTLQPQVAWYDAGGALLSTGTIGGTIAAAGSGAQSGTVTAPASAATAAVRFATNAAAGSFDVMYDAVLATDGGAVPAYFDGSTNPPATRWTGAAHSSTSQMLARGPATLLWASGSSDEVADTTPTIITGPAATFRRSRVLVAQLSFPPGPASGGLASLSLVDARPVPVLVGRK